MNVSDLIEINVWCRRQYNFPVTVYVDVFVRLSLSTAVGQSIFVINVVCHWEVNEDFRVILSLKTVTFEIYTTTQNDAKLVFQAMLKREQVVYDTKV